jgi:hypothetical protein
MFQVAAASVEEYLSFDPNRRSDLEQFAALVGKAAPELVQYFHAGTPAGEPGMRFKMIGYGPFHYEAKGGKKVQWPVIGVALQKNYVSVYFAVTKDGKAIVDGYKGRLGELRSGDNNFSFRTFSELDSAALSALVAESAAIVRANPLGTAERMQGAS